MRDQFDSKDLIRRIETHKHDLTLLLRECVLTPVDKVMHKKEAMTDLFFAEQLKSATEIFEKAKEIMDFFGSKWYDPTLIDDEDILQNLKGNVEHFITVRIAEIDSQIIPYYKNILANHIYFSGDVNFNKVYRLLREAVADWEYVREKLLEMDINVVSEDVENALFNLWEVLQDPKYGLDTINEANVIYVDEAKYLDVEVSIDKDMFLQHVLQNIVKNICKHAFGMPVYKQMRLTSKMVVVEIENETDDSVKVTIKNNGEPFKGDLTKVFEYGYGYGNTKGTGIGLCSLRDHMNDMGGGIEFNVDGNWVVYKLTFKK